MSTDWHHPYCCQQYGTSMSLQLHVYVPCTGTVLDPRGVKCNHVDKLHIVAETPGAHQFLLCACNSINTTWLQRATCRSCRSDVIIELESLHREVNLQVVALN